MTTQGKVALAGALGLVAGGALAQPYDEYAGQTVVAMFPAHPHYDAVMEVLPRFTEETGIEVEVDMLQYLAMREKQTLELTRPTGDYDLMGYVVFSKADYVYADQIEPLARFFMDPKLADPSYDSADLVQGYMENIGFAGGGPGLSLGPHGRPVRHPLRLGDERAGLPHRHLRQARARAARDLRGDAGSGVPDPRARARHGRHRVPRAVRPPDEPRLPSPPQPLWRRPSSTRIGTSRSTTRPA